MTGVVLSLVQLAAGVSVMHQPCPAYVRAPEGLTWSCYEPSTRTIYLASQDWHNDTVFHEYGHAYDLDALTDTDRARFTRLLGYRASRGWWQERIDSAPPAEEFANAYADCAMGKPRPFRSFRRYRRFCSLLPRSAYAVLIRYERAARAG